MRNMKSLQFPFVATALIATVLSVCIPFEVTPVMHALLYCIFVLAPLVMVLLYQCHVARERLAEYFEAVDEYRRPQYAKARKHIRFPLIVMDVPHTIAYLKSMGINPCRAGPLSMFA